MPDEHPDLRSQLINLGYDHLGRFRRLGELPDIEKAVENISSVVTLIPDDHPDLPSQLMNLGVSYGDRFRCLDDLDDLKRAVECTSRAIALVSDDHPLLPSLQMNMGVFYYDQFKRLGELDKLENAIEYQSRGLAMTRDADPDLPSRLISLGTSYSDRWRRLRERGDLEEAIKCKSRALALTTDDHPELPSRLTSLGESFVDRFKRLGEPGDIDKAIECGNRALSLTPDDHPALPSRLMVLGTSCADRFKRWGKLGDLEKAIEWQSRALALTAEDHPDLPFWLGSLGVAFADRFKRLGELSDLEKAIEHISRGLSLTPSDHPQLPLLFLNIGVCFSDRFKHLGELGDLEKAIKWQSHAIDLIPKDHPDLPSQLANVAVTSSARFRRLGELGDLEQAIKWQSSGLDLTPDDHPDLPYMLANLGALYSSRFKHLGEQDDLEKATRFQSRALALTPDDHPSLPSRLSGLVVSCSHRFMRTGKMDDIKDACTYTLRALALTPEGHPSLPTWHHNLAIFQFIRFQHTGNLFHLQESLHSFRKASQSPVGAPNARFEAAITWARCASEHTSLNPIEAYQTAIDLLPQFIWLGATTDQRYQDLDQAKYLAVSAGTTAICLSKYRLALEWLEHARCVVWTQNLMLRSPLDQLHLSHPDLATRMRAAASQLHQASSESRVSLELPSDLTTLDQASQQHRRLAGEYSELLSEARNLPGFEELLRPVKADELVRASQNGPIVLVNCDLYRCDALLVLPGQDEVIHIPLPNFTGEKALRCRSEMQASLRRKGIRERGVKVWQEPDHKICIENVLETLWNDIAKPILNYLGYMNDSSRDSLPHITWCPTGAMSFLPLHAAGDYNQPRSRVFDYAISSYTPTLTALLTSAPSSLHRDCRVLAIGQPNTPGRSSLPGTIKELASVKAHVQNKAQYSQLLNDQATITAVLDAMETHDWIHLACHAHQNVDDPTKSGFFLHDGTLDLALINRRLLKNKGLAFLSACQTATGDEKLPDEAVHLASGMLMAGYTSIIATMWSVNDTDAPLVADIVYGELMKDGKLGNGEAGRALHNAVAELRDKIGGKEFSRWVPYIHIGS
ncbi:unnamed protein product [Rhizoctonia solani]|uniref:CHAT domain-containing protein n=1 Tax=Rhizoctonia solani TaxID=456999 RepID=A0A8H3CC24_9AGAM|nr:unnamed protein product [Rhizoctonia solani]